MNIRTIITAIMVCTAMAVTAQTKVFVSSTAANDNGNGLTWETAKKTVAAGIAAAGDSGTVFVKAGSYSVSSQLVIPSGLSVKGGYSLTLTGTDTSGRELPGTNSRWENAAVCTILTGGGSNRIATVSGLLEGCVLRKGYTTGQGGGVFADGGTVRYCVFTECEAINETNHTAEGGGVYVRNGALLTNCVVTECRADNGPAVAGSGSSLINNTITRNRPTHCGQVSDYDGNVYNTIIVGEQCWTRENLRTTHYNDGTPIPFGNGAAASISNPYYYVNYNVVTASNLPNYGYLYNWPAVMYGAPSSNQNPSRVTGICPPGWHVPSSAEWGQLRTYVNSVTAYRCSGYDGQIGKAISSKTGWYSSTTTCQVGYNQSSNNATGFAAFPAGQFASAAFSEANNAFFFWTATEGGNDIAYYRYLYYNGNGLGGTTVSKSNGYSVRCVKHLGASVPIVHTATIPNTNVQSTQAICGGSCSDGGAEITAYGVCWSTSPNPTIDDAHTTDGTGEATFTTLITGLTNGVTYYVRAYAINSLGVVYGEERVITADDCGDPLSVTDIDGNTYNSVRIGTQCWMKENLRTTRFADGTEIALSTSTSSSYAYRHNPNDNPNYVAVYGYLYNWPAVMHGATSSSANPSGVQGVCPDGWHVPSDAEWTQLTNYLSSQSEYVCGDNNTYIAKVLASKTGWAEYTSSSYPCYVGYNREANNATGFGAMPAGYFNSYFGSRAYFWSSTQSGSSYAWYRYLSYSSSTVGRSDPSKSNGYSVRCLRND